MTVRSYLPSNTRLRSQEVGVVMFNHGGSSVAGDTGRDAKHASEELGLPVIAADRPGSGWSLPGQSQRLASDYYSSMSRLAERRIMPEVEALGLNGLILWGRSAAGLAALVATTTRELPVLATHVQEPVGWHDIDAQAGKTSISAYRGHQALLLRNEDNNIIKPEPTDQIGLAALRRKLQIRYQGPVDEINNQQLWRSRAAYNAAWHIAHRMPEVHLDIRIAEYSMVMQDYDEVRDIELNLLRERGPYPLRPVRLEVVPDTVHASFDRRDFSVGLLKQTVDVILPPATSV